MSHNCCQIGKSASWVNRVKILNNGEAKWLSAPIKRPNGTQPINIVEFAESDWTKRCYSHIDNAYTRAPFHKEVMGLLTEILQYPPLLLADFNMSSNLKIMEFLELDHPRIVNSSDYMLTSKATDKLVDILWATGGSEYLCGGGSDGYLEPGKFTEAGIDLVMLDFQEIKYPQHSSTNFVPGLSVIDSLMMLGPEGTRELIERKSFG